MLYAHTHTIYTHTRALHKLTYYTNNIAASYKVYRILVIFYMQRKKNCCQETNNINKISLYLFFYIIYKLLFKNKYYNNYRASIYS